MSAILSAYTGSAATVLGPSGDQTGAADTARINALTQAGKSVLLQNGTYYVTNLTIDSLGVLSGQGPGTILQAVAGTTGYMVALKTPASTYQVTVRDLTLIPNTGSLGGVQIDNTAFTSGGGVTDSLHTLQNVYVKNAGGDSFHLDNNVRSLRMTRCASYGSGGDGIYVGVGCTDSSFTGCIAGAATLYPWHFLGWNNFVSSCKGFYGGWNGSAFDTSHSAWLVGTNASYNTFASCSAQNGALHGWDLQACKNCTFSGCEADNNSSGTGTTGAGFNTNGILNCTLVGCTGDTGQSYGIQVAGTQTNTCFVSNTVSGSVGAFNYVSGGGYFLIQPGNVDLSGQTVSFGNVDIKVAGTGVQVKEGSNCKQGTAVLNGTVNVVVSNTSVTANSRIFLTHQSNSGTPGVPYVTARTPGTSFTVVSTGAADLGTVAYEIFEPG